MTDEAKKFYTDKFSNVYGSMLVTPVGRAAWTFLDRKNTFNATPKYSLTILFDKSDETVCNGLDMMIAHYNELLTFKFGANVEQQAAVLEIPAIQDGDDPKTSKYQGFPGSYFLKANNAQQPEVYDAKKLKLDPATILPGMLVRAVVTPMVCSKGAAYKLLRVQFVRDDGTRFHGGQDPSSLLDAIGEEGSPPVVEVKESMPQPVVAATPQVVVQAAPAQNARLQAAIQRKQAAPAPVAAAPAKKGIGGALNKL